MRHAIQTSFSPLRLMTAMLLAFAAIPLAGCVERLPVGGVPGVPEGFGERVPDVPLSGYLFVRPPDADSTVTIRTNLRERDGSMVPWTAEARSVSLWMSPADTDQNIITTTVRFTFNNELDALSAHTALSRVDTDGAAWARRDGRHTEIVLGEQRQVELMRGALNGNRFVPYEDVAETGMWRHALKLPQAPSQSVIAAGFTQGTAEDMREILDWLAEQGIVDLTQFSGMIETLQLDNAVFAVYGDSLPPLSEDTTPAELAEHGMTGLAILRPGVPAPLVPWGFTVAALRAGMERVESQNGRYFRYDNEDTVVIAQVRQGDIQTAMSARADDAVQILELIPN